MYGDILVIITSHIPFFLLFRNTNYTLIWRAEAMVWCSLFTRIWTDSLWVVSVPVSQSLVIFSCNININQCIFNFAYHELRILTPLISLLTFWTYQIINSLSSVRCIGPESVWTNWLFSWLLIALFACPQSLTRC